MIIHFKIILNQGHVDITLGMYEEIFLYMSLISLHIIRSVQLINFIIVLLQTKFDNTKVINSHIRTIMFQLEG